jgi:hypothetical protein
VTTAPWPVGLYLHCAAAAAAGPFIESHSQPTSHQSIQDGTIGCDIYPNKNAALEAGRTCFWRIFRRDVPNQNRSGLRVDNSGGESKCQAAKFHSLVPHS